MADNIRDSLSDLSLGDESVIHSPANPTEQEMTSTEKDERIAALESALRKAEQEKKVLEQRSV